MRYYVIMEAAWKAKIIWIPFMLGAIIGQAMRDAPDYQLAIRTISAAFVISTFIMWLFARPEVANGE